ncbi:MAG: HlyU family transcriptional regulator [Hyphomicrobiaceae bacterium]
MSFLKRLFGAGSEAGPAAAAKTTEYKGFTIEARPYKEGGQFQLAGVISKEIDGVRKEHTFVRADRFSGQDEAAEFALAKGRQIIDERGDKVFG